jgi:hypothetical protein
MDGRKRPNAPNRVRGGTWPDRGPHPDGGALREDEQPVFRQPSTLVPNTWKPTRAQLALLDEIGPDAFSASSSGISLPRIRALMRRGLVRQVAATSKRHHRTVIPVYRRCEGWAWK